MCEIERLRLELEEATQFKDLVAHVMHDIRSPLAALQAIVHSTDGIDQDKQAIITSSTKRIQEIAYEFLNRYQQNSTLRCNRTSMPEQPVTRLCQNTAPRTLYSVTESILAEKRAEVIKTASISLTSTYLNHAEAAYTHVDVPAFSRILSNLINNSIEAIGTSKGQIDILLDRNQDCLVLTIRDNGNGIAPEHLHKIGKKGFSVGKANGTGLGLSHALSTIANWNGKMTISSTVGVGTSVKIALPLAHPCWLLPTKIALASHSTVVVTTDDQSAHLTWHKRLSNLCDSFHIKMVNLYSPNELLNWYRKHLDIPNVAYFCDDTFRNSEITGLDIVESIGMGPCSTLITSNWNDEAFIKRCRRTGIKLLQKSRLNRLSISVT